MAVRAGAQNIIHYVGVDLDWNNEEHIEAVETLLEMDASIVTTLMIDKSFLYPIHPDWFEEVDMLYVYQNSVNDISPGQLKRATIYERILNQEYGLENGSLIDFMKPQGDDLKILLSKGMNVVLGTDTGNDFNFAGYSLHEEMQLLQMGEMSPIDILKMGTLNAAKMMHAEDSLGSIEVGKLADMILLDESPLSNIENTLTINTVFKGGRVQKRINN
ncbi:amidohydrolase family protein [Ekhidna sp.]|jgi:imidazolonepropionase-like amidohydrolase|uniref:amidohydrolase family protein n=1 Tax=Ekhidna sp. TaxID=2608089 RepID=UPI0032EF09F6